MSVHLCTCDWPTNMLLTLSTKKSAVSDVQSVFYTLLLTSKSPKLAHSSPYATNQENITFLTHKSLNVSAQYARYIVNVCDLFNTRLIV